MAYQNCILKISCNKSLRVFGNCYRTCLSLLFSLMQNKTQCWLSSEIYIWLKCSADINDMEYYYYFKTHMHIHFVISINKICKTKFCGVYMPSEISHFSSASIFPVSQKWYILYISVQIKICAKSIKSYWIGNVPLNIKRKIFRQRFLFAQCMVSGSWRAFLLYNVSICNGFYFLCQH